MEITMLIIKGLNKNKPPLCFKPARAVIAGIAMEAVEKYFPKAFIDLEDLCEFGCPDIMRSIDLVKSILKFYGVEIVQIYTLFEGMVIESQGPLEPEDIEKIYISHENPLEIAVERLEKLGKRVSGAVEVWTGEARVVALVKRRESRAELIEIFPRG